MSRDLLSYIDTPECFVRHMGLWSVHWPWFQSVVNAAKDYRLPERNARTAGDMTGTDISSLTTEDGILVLALHGPMQKAESKFGGTSTVSMRRALRAGKTSGTVRAAMVHADSPGGHVDGTHELSEDVRLFAQEKPIHFHIEDLGASAAIWAMAHADRITANAPAEVGSIGAFALLHDFSEAMEREGVRVIRVGSTARKGVGAPGLPIDEELIADVQASVDRVHTMFTTALRRGRGLSAAQVNAVADGRLFGAQEAQEKGLIDRVESFEEAMSNLRRQVRNRSRRQSIEERVDHAESESPRALPGA